MKPSSLQRILMKFGLAKTPQAADKVLIITAVACLLMGIVMLLSTTNGESRERAERGFNPEYNLSDDTATE